MFCRVLRRLSYKLCARSMSAQRSSSESFRCATFNLLAPCYKNLGVCSEPAVARVGSSQQASEQGFRHFHSQANHSEDDKENVAEGYIGWWNKSGWWNIKESSEPDLYIPRYEAIIDLILDSQPIHMLCLQEYWFNEDVEDLFDEKLGHKYSIVKLKRQGYKTDGLAILLDKSLTLIHVEHVHFTNNLIGQRVALLVHVQIAETGHEMLLMTTHLNYCHSYFDQYVRMAQIKHVIDGIENYISKHDIPHIPVLLAGDFNSPREDPVYDYILDAGFNSSHLVLHETEPAVTHKDHMGQHLSVDFIFYRNASKYSLLPKSAFLLPTKYSDKDWPDEFTLSDHRPLVAEFDTVIVTKQDHLMRVSAL